MAYIIAIGAWPEQTRWTRSRQAGQLPIKAARMAYSGGTGLFLRNLVIHWNPKYPLDEPREDPNHKPNTKP